MYNSGKVILGIIVFLVLFGAPVWLTLSSSQADEVPELKYPENSTECVYEKEHMRAYHMEILNDWRDKVVRENIRYEDINGKKVEMSLTKTCMKCHDDKVNFCDKCHDYLGVTPYCWDCHVMPQEITQKPAVTTMSEKQPCCDKHKDEVKISEEAGNEN